MKDYPRDTAAGLAYAMDEVLLYRDALVDYWRATRRRPEKEARLSDWQVATARRNAWAALRGAGYAPETANEILADAKKEADQILEAEARERADGPKE